MEALVRGARSAAQPRAGVSALGKSEAVSALPHNKVSELSDMLLFGRGFFVLRRLPLERLAQAEAVRLFRSVASALGRVLASQEIRGRQFGEDGAFVVAEGDILAQLCTSAPARGGELRLASAGALHNEMARRCPDVLACLYTSMGQGRPLFAIAGDRLEVHIDRRSAQRLARGVMDRSGGEQQKALAVLSSLIDELALDVVLEPGDMLFADSRRVLIAQRPHESFRELGKEHAVMRLWLAYEQRTARLASARRESLRAQAAA
jgi:hypothetical protein